METLRYSFTVQPEEESIVHCEVPRPFKIKFYEIEREEVEVFSIGFDNRRNDRINSKRMLLALDTPEKINNDFSFKVNGSKLVFPETIEVTLYGE